MKIINLETPHGVEKGWLTTGRYPMRQPGNFFDPIHISFMTEEGPYCTFTVNLPLCGMLDDKVTAIDSNNCPFAGKFLEENGIAEFIGKGVQSGYCTYPLYRINTEKLKELTEE